MKTRQTSYDDRAFPMAALVGAYFLVSTCSAMTSLAISLHFSALGSGEALVAGILVSGAGAQIVLSPLLTPIFDRMSSPTVALGATGVEIVVLVVLLCWPVPAALIAGNVVLSSLAGLSVPAILVMAEEVSVATASARVFSRMDTARLVGSFVGPVLGGALLDEETLRTALATEICALTISFGVIFSVGRVMKSRGGAVDASEGAKPGFFRSVIEAPSLLLRNGQAREALVSIWAAIIFTSIYNVALVFFATRTLHTSGLMYALLAQCFIVGRITGARGAAHVGPADARTILFRSGVLMGFCIALPGCLPSLWLSVPMFFLAGACNALQVAALRIIVVSSVPADVKPKALSTMGTINNSAMLVGYVIGAPVLSVVGPAAALIVSGVGTTAFTLLPHLLGRARALGGWS